MKLCLMFYFILFSSITVRAEDPLEVLRKLVEMSSGSNDLKGVLNVQNFFSKKLKFMGFETVFVPYPKDEKASLLIGTLKGSSSNFITFIVHADTVFETKSGFTKFQISDNERFANGPGVIDDKGGMVVLLSGLKTYLKRNRFPKYSFRVISSPA